ncbi:MAG TPA: FKBP-type peptidyl-prolyl cis-trans isomerase [Polyangia bacterium]|jgi:peptidylprolyl isomerase|nr:FKBP-type peptidyl-prolyl cis-trans isomerase [Polyangia bacterium]
MCVPRSLVSLLVLSLSAAACARGASAPVAAPAAASPAAPDASATPGMSGVSWVTPPPADVSAPPADAEREPNGVARKILARGKGNGLTHPTTKDFVVLRYAGWERNGKQFEGTDADGTPRRYDLKELAPGVAAELAQMVEGDKRRIWIPGALAYANRPNFANAPRGDMTFEIELVRIIQVPPAPENVAAAPKEAKTTKSGLAYVVLKKGTGKRHPTEDTRADVIYTAWKPNGDMFQTSLIAGDSSPVRVKRLPAGWREAMVHMVEGDKWRLWLPGKLAFGDLRPGQEPLPFGPPPGPVVFDVELVKILE